MPGINLKGFMEFLNAPAKVFPDDHVRHLRRDRPRLGDDHVKVFRGRNIEARVNVVVAAETYKFAPRTIIGEMIEIEERPAEEVLSEDIARTLPHVTVRNPGFDVTPAEYIDMIVTEAGAIPPQMAYVIIREYLGWGIEEFQESYDLNHHPEG